MPAPGARSGPRWSALAREITIILVVKAVALYALWLAFFSSPAARHLDAGGVAQSLVQPSVPAAHPQEADRATRPGTR